MPSINTGGSFAAELDVIPVGLLLSLMSRRRISKAALVILERDPAQTCQERSAEQLSSGGLCTCLPLVQERESNGEPDKDTTGNAPNNNPATG